MAVQRLGLRRKRFISPHNPFQRPKLEPIVQSLYSCAAFDNAILPAEVLLFQYGEGAQVAGAGGGALASASKWHTNMQNQGVLSSPKNFVVEGIRLVIPQLDGGAAGTAPALIDPSTGTADENSDLGDDMNVLWYTGVLRFFVGSKDYSVGPFPQYPGNTGFGGFGATGATFTAEAWMRDRSIQTQGTPYRTNRYPVTIYANQNFGVQLSFPQPTRATLLDEHLVYCYLDGVLFREVQ